MTPELLSLLTGAAVPAGGLAATLCGPVACAWPAMSDELMLRVAALKRARIGPLRLAGGGALIALVLSGGALAAFAAEPASPPAPVPTPAMPPPSTAPQTTAAPQTMAAPQAPDTTVTVLAKLQSEPAPAPAAPPTPPVITAVPMGSAPRDTPALRKAYADWTAQVVVEAQAELDKANAALAAAPAEGRAAAQVTRMGALMAFTNAQNNKTRYAALAESPTTDPAVIGAAVNGALAPPWTFSVARLPQAGPRPSLPKPPGFDEAQGAAVYAEQNAQARVTFTPP